MLTEGDTYLNDMGAGILTSSFEEALRFAHHHHMGQKRKRTEIPYISHLLCVASIVLENGGDEDTAIAGLLHDAIEDHPKATTPEDVRDEIRSRFGAGVLEIVEGCTDTDEHPKPPWRERKERFLETLSDAKEEVCVVAAADKLCNVRSLIFQYRKIGEKVWSRFSGKKDGSLWYYRTVAEILHDRIPGALSDTLDSTVAELESMASDR